MPAPTPTRPRQYAGRWPRPWKVAAYRNIGGSRWRLRRSRGENFTTVRLRLGRLTVLVVVAR